MLRRTSTLHRARLQRSATSSTGSAPGTIKINATNRLREAVRNGWPFLFLELEREVDLLAIVERAQRARVTAGALVIGIDFIINIRGKGAEAVGTVRLRYVRLDCQRPRVLQIDHGLVYWLAIHAQHMAEERAQVVRASALGGSHR